MGDLVFWYDLTGVEWERTMEEEGLRIAFFRRHPDAREIIALFECLPSAHFYAKDDQHRYVAANAQTLSGVFGLDSMDELLGRTDLDFQPPALAEAYHAEDRRVMDSRDAIPNQVWLVPHVRGTPRWYVSSKTPLFDPDRRVIGIAGVMYPIETPEEQESFFHELLPAVRFIDQHYTTAIAMEKLSAMTGLSSTQFNSRFRSILRMSPTEYTLSRRIQAAQRRLVDSEMSISEIGATVGFFDQSHFTKRFRRFTGMTPAAYRKRFRNSG